MRLTVPSQLAAPYPGILLNRLMNMRSITRFGLLRTCSAAMVFLLFLNGCQRDEAYSAEFLVFGTVVEVSFYGASDERVGQAITQLQQMFQNMHRDWHAWELGRLADINKAFASGQVATADEGIVEMITRSQHIEERTGGRFNPAIGGLIRLWGFHTSEYPIIGPPPDQAEINEVLMHAPSSRDIRVNGLQVRSDNPHVQLDFGGIAKGYAVDLSIELIRELGITSAIVNAGGDLRAMGRHGDRPWRIAVRKPGGGVIGVVEVSGDESLFTSGNYERFRQDETQRYPHILDPRTGWPVADVASVTVIANEGLLADAAATALVVAGLEDWPEVAQALGLAQVMVIDEAGVVYMTPDMAKRVRFTEDVDRVIIDAGSNMQ
jgi:thiamine biosynthesis lipoprotein